MQLRTKGQLYVGIVAAIGLATLAVIGSQVVQLGMDMNAQLTTTGPFGYKLGGELIAYFFIATIPVYIGTLFYTLHTYRKIIAGKYAQRSDP